MNDSQVHAQPTPFGLDVTNIQLTTPENGEVQGQRIDLYTVVGQITLFADNAGVRQIIETLQRALDKGEMKIIRPTNDLILPS